MPSRATALRTASGNLSSDSSGVCTPTTTSPAGPLLRSSDSTQARELRQFTHSKAQNSTSTTLPLSPASVRGAELIQSSARWWVNSDGALGAASATIDQAVSAASALRVIPFIYHPHKASFYSMNGRICVVTGATHGIGRATARALAASGATVLVHGRDHARARAVAEDISRDTGNPEVRFVQADFPQLAQVRRLAQQLHSLLPRLDVLINNAGMMAAAHARSADGYELTFAVNHLAPFLLTNLLLEKLKASAPARVIVVASEAHRRATLDFGDLMNAGASGWGAYQRSKLANVLFARELARRLAGTGVTVNALHPGLIRRDRKSTRLNSSHLVISYAVFCLNTKVSASALRTPISRAPSETDTPMMFMIPIPPTLQLTPSMPDRPKQKFCVVSPRLLSTSHCF